MGLKKTITSGVRAGIGAYKRNRAAQARMDRERDAMRQNAERTSVAIAKAVEERQQKYGEMIQRGGKLALVANFCEGKGGVEPPLTGRRLAIGFKENDFGPVDTIVVEGLIGGGKQDSVEQFIKSAQLLADGLLMACVAREARVGHFNHSVYNPLEPSTVHERVAYHELQNRGAMGYVAIVNVAELELFGVGPEGHIAGEDIAHGGVVVPDETEPGRWRQLIPGQRHDGPFWQA